MLAFLLLAGLATWLGLGAQPAESQGQTYRVPYRMSETLHILVRVKFNGKGPFNLIVDTGAPMLLVTEEVAKGVGAKPDQSGWAVIDSVEFEGGAKLERAQAFVEDIFQIKGMNGLGLAGRELHGVVGYTALAHFRMEFDLSQNVMHWTKLDYSPPPLIPIAGAGGDKPRTAPPELNAIGGLAEMFGSLLGRKADGGPKKVRGFIGVIFSQAEGVSVQAVLPEGPAAQAGLEPGDEIRAVNGRSVSKIETVMNALDQMGTDADVKLLIRRNDEEKTVLVRPVVGL